MKRRRTNKSQCPEPLNTMIDILGAIALGAYSRHKIKQDYKAGHGEESAKAASMVFGAGALRNGSRGIISLGGLVGVTKGINDIQREQQNHSEHSHATNAPPAISDEGITGKGNCHKMPSRRNLWRMHCEDGSIYGVNPEDYNSADEYKQALENAKHIDKNSWQKQDEPSVEVTPDKRNTNHFTWRKYCEDGKPYGVNPEDYETADEYEEALNTAKRNNQHDS